jgi:tryptophan 2-monooxygenase
MPLPNVPPAFAATIQQHRDNLPTPTALGGFRRSSVDLPSPTRRPLSRAASFEGLCLPTTHKATKLISYLDAPDMGYAHWLEGLAAAKLPIGTPGDNLNNLPVAIIGAGVAGLTAAYELGKAGVDVVVFEQAPNVGGRCHTAELEGGNLLELGAMRFPPAEVAMTHYLDVLNLVARGRNATTGEVVKGLDMLPLFPDPGKVPTWVCWQDTKQLWIDDDPQNPNPPVGFEVVYWGWLGLATKGITQGGKNVDFQSPSWFGKMCRKPLENAAAIAAAWQKYITAFQGKTFYSVLEELFTGRFVSPISGLLCDIPAFDDHPAARWTFDDFDKFGTVGIGSGGFGSLYSENFAEIMRIIINGLEHEQRLYPGRVDDMPVALAEACSDSVQFKFSTPVRSIAGTMTEGFTLTDREGNAHGPYSRLIVATTTRAMELATNLVSPASHFLPQSVRSAVRRTHIATSCKIAARIKAFWTTPEGASLPRVMQCDTTPCQAYTLDYDVTEYNGVRTGVCFISYTWEDDAVKKPNVDDSCENLDEAYRRFEYFRKVLRESCAMVPDPTDPSRMVNWADLLEPYTLPDRPNDLPVHMLEWQSEPYFNGAFKLSQPGQDTYVQSMYWDYQRAGTSSDTGVYIAGDCCAWTSGWIEGALQTSLNAACAVLASSGGVVHNVPGTANPMTAINRYTYFNGASSLPLAGTPAAQKLEVISVACARDSNLSSTSHESSATTSTPSSPPQKLFSSARLFMGLFTASVLAAAAGWIRPPATAA